MTKKFQFYPLNRKQEAEYRVLEGTEGNQPPAEFPIESILASSVRRIVCAECRTVPIAAFCVHVVLAVAQLSILYCIAWRCGVFDPDAMLAIAPSPFAAEQAPIQFWGHTVPASMLFACGVAAMLKPVRAVGTLAEERRASAQRRKRAAEAPLNPRCCGAAVYPEDSWQSFAVLEGKGYVITGVVYNVGEWAFSKSWRRILHEQGFVRDEIIHHGLHGAMFCVLALLGAFQLLLPHLAAEYRSLRRVTPLLFAALFAIFIYEHKQPNDIGYTIHAVIVVWVVLSGLLRAFFAEGMLKPSGLFMCTAAYSLYGGQVGLCMWGTALNFNFAIYCFLWSCAGVAAAALYLAIFARPGSALHYVVSEAEEVGRSSSGSGSRKGHHLSAVEGGVGGVALDADVDADVDDNEAAGLIS